MTDTPTLPPPPAQPPLPPRPLPDRRALKAQAAAAKAAAKALRPWWRKKRVLLPVALAVVIGIAVAASSGSSSNSQSLKASGSAATSGSTSTKHAPATSSGIDTKSNNDTHAPPNDIDKGWQCTTDELGFMTAKGTLTNHSSGESNYMIEVRFTDSAGTQIATGADFANNVAPGTKATWEANSLKKAPAGGSHCKITDVNRYAS
jgi:hypothetical protein